MLYPPALSLVLAGLLACATTPTVPDTPVQSDAPAATTTPNEPEPPTVTTMPAEPQTPTTIVYGDDARANVGEQVRFVGVAYDAKLGAIVVTDSFSVYCIELDEWPMGITGQTVEVTGRLERTDQFAATVNAKGEISQGTAGGDWLLHGVQWQVVEPTE